MKSRKPCKAIFISCSLAFLDRHLNYRDIIHSQLDTAAISLECQRETNICNSALGWRVNTKFIHRSSGNKLKYSQCKHSKKYKDYNSCRLVVEWVQVVYNTFLLREHQIHLLPLLTLCDCTTYDKLGKHQQS